MNFATLKCYLITSTDMGFHINQWRIQDFSQVGALTPKDRLFSKYFAENCMKMKEFGPPGGRVIGDSFISANVYLDHMLQIKKETANI